MLSNISYNNQKNIYFGKGKINCKLPENNSEFASELGIPSNQVLIYKNAIKQAIKRSKINELLSLMPDKDEILIIKGHEKTISFVQVISDQNIKKYNENNLCNRKKLNGYTPNELLISINPDVKIDDLTGLINNFVVNCTSFIKNNLIKESINS